MNYRPLIQWVSGMVLIILAGFLLTENTPGNTLDYTDNQENSQGKPVSELALSSRKRMAEQMGLQLPAWPLSIQAKVLNQWGDSLSQKLYATSADPLCNQKVEAALEHFSGDTNLPALLLSIQSGDSSLFNHICRQAGKTVFLLEPGKRGADWWIPAIHFNAENRLFRYLVGDGSKTKGLLRGDLGYSFAGGKPVSVLIGARWPRSVILGLLALLLGICVGLPLAIKFERRRYLGQSPWPEYLTLTITAIPGFVGGTGLLLIFANRDVLDWFPVGGWEPVGGFPEQMTTCSRFLASLPYWILPLISLSYGMIASTALQLGGLLEEETRSMYFLTAEAKGLSRRAAIHKHALPNLYPVIVTLITQSLPWIMGGSVVIETLFSWPGLGKLSIDSIWTKDQPVLLGLICFTGIISLTGFMLSRYIQEKLDPRTKQDGYA